MVNCGSCSNVNGQWCNRVERMPRSELCVCTTKDYKLDFLTVTSIPELTK